MTLDGKGKGWKRETPMNSTPTPKAIEPHNALIARADEQLAHAYEQIAGADEELARLSEQLAKLERDAERPPSAGPGPQLPSGRPALRALVGQLERDAARQPSAGPGSQSPRRRAALRALVGLPLAACIVVAALVLQSSYGGGAKPVAPLPAQPAPSIVQAAAAEAAPPQAARAAQTAPQNAAPTATAALPDHAQLLETMARDLANVQRNIEQLKASQQQIANDNSKAIEELKASQEEMKRVLARVSEQNPPKTSPLSTQPTPTLRRPERTLRSPYARARPRIPREWMYDEW
jgi:hypothetical protein